MTGSKRVNTRDDGKPESARSKTGDPKAPKETVVSPTRTPGTSKKKHPKKNGTVKSATSKDGDTEKPKKTKKHKKENREVGDTDQDVDPQTNAQTKPRKVQVKQRSFSSLLATGSSVVAVSDTAANPTATATPAVEETGGFASGNYGVLLETKSAEKLCLSLALQKRHVEAMKRAFRREEQLGTEEITTEEFFSMLHEQPRQLTKGLFEGVGLARNLRRMRFDDFVLCVATVATWSKSELLHYAFKQFDVDESGVMDARELRAFCEGLKNDSSFYFAKNVNTAREKLVLRDRNNHHQLYKEKYGQSQTEADTLVDLEDLAKGSTEYQVAFYPLLQLQQNVRACALGERFWAGVTQRRQEVEVIVHYMRLHKGTLPAFSILNRIIAYLLPYSQANANLVVHKLAILKFAEEERIWQEQAQSRAEVEKLALTGIQEEGHPQPDLPKR